MFNIVSVCKGGGYMYCRTIPEHPKRNSKGLYPLHRVLMENKLGRILDKNEVVHHKDEDKNNNDINNLEVVSRSKHSCMHAPIIENIKLKCFYCEEYFYLKPHLARLRLKRSDKPCCSRSCSGKAQKINTEIRTGTGKPRGED